MIPRSHTPPPPWSDSTTNSSSTRPSSSVIRTRRELGEYLAQLTISQNNKYLPLYQAQQHQQHSGTVHRDVGGCLTNKQVCREQQIRAQQRTRPMPSRWEFVDRYRDMSSDVKPTVNSNCSLFLPCSHFINWFLPQTK